MKLEQFRIKMRFNVLQLSRFLGFSHVSVGRWLRGGTPSTANASKVVKKTGGEVSFEDLIPER